MNDSAEQSPTIVVGAGIAGLVVARQLVLQGHHVQVLEAGSRAGGQVASIELDGLRLDAGAEAFATRDGTVREYLARLGLDEQIVAPLDAPAWLHSSDGVTVPLPAVSLLGIPATPLAADVVAVVGRRGAWRGMLDALLPGPVGSRLTSLGALVRRRMGTAVLERLVAPVVEGIHSRHPDQLPVSAVPGLVHNLLRENSLGRAVARMRIDAPAGSLVASLEGGMSTLVEALVAELDRFGVTIEYGVSVTEVHSDRVLIAADGASEGAPTLRYGRVVIAAPGLVAPAEESPPSSTETHLVTLVLAPDAALAAAPRGTGVLVARGGQVVARALTHVTAKWSGVRAAAQGREVVRLSYEQPASLEQARRDAEAMLGLSIPSDRVIASTMVTWRRAGRIVIDGSIPVVGEQVAGTGLAAVIAQALEVAEQWGAPDSDLAERHERETAE